MAHITIKEDGGYVRPGTLSLADLRMRGRHSFLQRRRVPTVQFIREQQHSMTTGLSLCLHLRSIFPARTNACSRSPSLALLPFLLTCM
jgi:hypothetical protein